MSASKKGTRDKAYEEASTQLVDIDEFKKYMAESEGDEAKAASQAGAPAPSPRPSANLAGPSAGPVSLGPARPASSPAPNLGPGAPVSSPSPAADAPDAPPQGSKARTAMMIGVVSLIPGVGIIAGPVAIQMARAEQAAIAQGNAPTSGLDQANLGLYLGAAGTAVSILAILYGLVG